ncbi:MAG TPA: type II secretion system F family protein [Polyangiaceae bacterium]|jgi:tight adherence protein C|nr:type II secretion system F family protein [Polyangiaceae bacterium]
MSLLLVLLRGSGMLAAFIALFSGVYGIAAAPTVQASPLGLRGLRRVRTLRSNPTFERLEPLLRWLGVRLQPLLGDALRERLDRQIMLAGDFWGLVPEEFVALSLVSAAGGAGFGWALAALLEKGALYPLVACALGLTIPYLELSSAQQARMKNFQNGLPYVIDLLALALSAGLDFPGAVQEVVEKSSNPEDALVEELGFLLQEQKVGKTRKAALLQFAARAQSESVKEFVAATVQAEERGNPLGHILQIQAEASRRRRSVRAEEAAAKASVKIMMPLMLAFVAVILLIAAPLALQLQSTFNAD